MALSKTSLNVVRVCAAVALLAIVLVATLVFHVQDHLGELITWIEDHKLVGSLSFVGLYALFTGDGFPSCIAWAVLWRCAQENRANLLNRNSQAMQH